MFIIRYRKIWYAFSILLVAASAFSVFYFGLKPGIDFTGGSLIEVEYENERPEISALQEMTKNLGLGNVSVQSSGDNGAIVRSRELSEDEHQSLLSALSSSGALKEIRFDSIGPAIGKELFRKSWIAMALVVMMIILYIAFVFRGVSHPVSSFNYGLMAVVALIHDVFTPLGVFAVLGKIGNVEIDALFVTAMLTVLGFSVHDTIVVFDRIRENLKKGVADNFEEIVGMSVNQTIIRSINTSLTVILVLLAVFFLGGETTRYFALALIIGVTVGTYSSIFLASPLLITLYKFQQRRK